MGTHRRTKAAIGTALALGALVASTLSPAAAASKTNPYPRDKKLALQDVQMLSTHNSYHLRPDRPLVPNEPADFEHPSLDVQLSQQGVRSLELDAFNGPDFPVLHTPIIDERSSCVTIEACLQTVNTWSRAPNPGHFPLVLYVETKPLTLNANPSIQQILDNYNAEHMLTNWDAAGLDRLDATVRRVFGKTLITPDEVRGKRATLRAAILKDGWPSLAKTRGGVLVSLLSTDATRDLYLTGAPSLEKRAMFVPSEPADPYAAIIKRDVPQPKHVPSLVRQNFLVRSRADADAKEARANDLARAITALDSGANVIATDYPVADPTIGPYVVDLPGTNVVRCNPVTAPKSCRDSDLENPRGLRKP